MKIKFKISPIQRDMFNSDIYKLISLNLDYDDLKQFSKTCTCVYELLIDNIFWMDKIYCDFLIRVSVDHTTKLKQTYIQLAGKHWWPIDGAEKYAHCCRDLCRLLINAIQNRKPANKIFSKLKNYLDSDLNIENIIAFVISGESTDPLVLTAVALIFDDLTSLENICTDLTYYQMEKVWQQMAILGNSDSFEYLYSKKEIVDIYRENTQSACHVVPCPIPPDDNIIYWASCKCNVELMKYLIENKKDLTPHDLNMCLIEATKYHNTEVVKYLVNVGATNLTDILQRCLKNKKGLDTIIDILIDILIDKGSEAVNDYNMSYE